MTATQQLVYKRRIAELEDALAGLQAGRTAGEPVSMNPLQTEEVGV